MKLLPVFALLLLLSCGQNNSKETKPSNDSIGTADDTVSVKEQVTTNTTNTDSVPKLTALGEEVERGLKSNSSEWVVVTDATANWPKDEFDYFIAPRRTKNREDDYPYIATSDFDGDRKRDAAVLVNQPGTKNYAIAIIRNMLSANPTIYYWKDDIDVAAVSIIPKGNIDGLKGEHIALISHAIGIEYFEKSSFVIYWDGSGWKRVWTGD